MSLNHTFTFKHAFTLARALFAIALALCGPAAVRAGEASPAVFDEAEKRENAAYAALTPAMRRWDAEKLRQIGRNLSGLPDEVASAALWLAAQAPERVETMQFLAQALSSPSSAVRRQAADILAADGSADALRLLLGRIATEGEPDTMRHLIGALGHMPEKQAVTNLMEIMLRGNAGQDVISAAGNELRRLTRSSLPDNAVAWRDWWLDNSHLYR